LMTSLLLVFFGAIYAKLATLHTTDSDIPNHYIVVFKKDVSKQSTLTQVENLKSNGLKIKHVYKAALKGFSAELTSDQLLVLRKNPHVDYIEGDQMAHLGDCSPEGSDSWGQTRISQVNLKLDGTYYASATGGAGVDAYVMDTGVFKEHIEFRPARAIDGFKAEQSWLFADANGHGTHVSSTICGNLYGVAKKCRIINVKVLGDNGSGQWSGIIAGVDYVITNSQEQKNPSVINLSLGGGKMVSVNEAVDAAVVAGVNVAVAAGNSNDDACRYSPASAPLALTVGSTDVGSIGGVQKDVRSSFSNFGTCVDVFAPGSNIKGAWIGNTDATRVISGTSMASPHVAGAIALLLGDEPKLTTKEVSELITGDSTKSLIDFRCGSRPACDASPNSLLFNGCVAPPATN